MNSINLNIIHHIAIICSDKDAALHFYHDLLGFPIIRSTYREDREDWKIDLQLNDDTELESLGISCEEIRTDTCTGKPMTFFKNPDGLPIEIHE